MLFRSPCWNWKAAIYNFDSIGNISCFWKYINSSCIQVWGRKRVSVIVGVLSYSCIVPVSEEWNLIVVNHWNEIPEDYSVTLTELSNEQKVDSWIYPYLQEM